MLIRDVPVGFGFKIEFRGLGVKPDDRIIILVCTIRNGLMGDVRELEFEGSELRFGFSLLSFKLGNSTLES